MAHKIFSSVSATLAAVILATVGQGPAWAQSGEPPSGNPVVQSRCATVTLNSETPLLPPRLIGPYLQQRDDFRASRLVLTDDAGAADASVTLSRSGNSNTQIVVANRQTGRYVSAINDWTDYPGMVALSIMNQLREVCPGSIAAAQHPRTVAPCAKPPAELQSVATIAGCSQTSWMDDREIYKALVYSAELKQVSVRVLPTCAATDAMVDVTHNLNLTVEWFWKLRTHGGKTVSSGRVIAFDQRDAASKIAAALTREMASAHGTEVQTASAVGISAAETYGASGHSVRVLLLPTDFSVADTRTSLYIDSERVIARDINNRVIFNVTREKILDAHLHADWRRSFQLSDPTPLALQTAQRVGAVADDAGLLTADALAQPHSRFCRAEASVWGVLTGNGPLNVPNICPALDLGETALSTAALIGYLGAGTVLAQIPTRAEILEIAWEQDGSVKTVALQVPLHESKRLLRALRPAGSGAQEQTCSSPTMVAASQK